MIDLASVFRLTVNDKRLKRQEDMMNITWTKEIKELVRYLVFLRFIICCIISASNEHTLVSKTAQVLLFGLKNNKGERDSKIHNNIIKPSQKNTNTPAPTKQKIYVRLKIKSSGTCDFYNTNNEWLEEFKINSLDIGMIRRYSCSLIVSDVVTNEGERC